MLSTAADASVVMSLHVVELNMDFLVSGLRNVGGPEGSSIRPLARMLFRNVPP